MFIIFFMVSISNSKLSCGLTALFQKQFGKKRKKEKKLIKKCLSCGLKSDDLISFNNVGPRITLAIIVTIRNTL